jgi:hypothetical protein
MAYLVELTSNKTYATHANAVKAVEKVLGPNHATGGGVPWYFIHKDENGRFFPVFVGQRALDAQLHFKFTVLAA